MDSSASDTGITGEVLCLDVLIKVFEYLSTSDLLSMALVCKEWKKTVDCKSLWQGRHVCIDPMRPFDLSFLGTFQQRGIQYVSLVATKCARPSKTRLTYRLRAIMQCFTPTLRELTIQSMRLYSRDIYAVFSQKMECLEKLELNNVKDANWSSFLRLSKQCPNLQHLNVKIL